MDDLITLTPRGLYCPLGDFYVDPWRAVEHALITHAHSDHARPGSRQYHAAAPGVGLLRQRLGGESRVNGHAYGQPLQFGAAVASFHPAGHVLGSAQIRVEGGGQVWVISGDYKRERDLSCAAFEVVPCDVFVTEATFALPIYRWDPIAQVMDELCDWWTENAAAGRASVLSCYALGKAQRILAELGSRTERTVYLHGAIQALLETYESEGVELVPTQPVSAVPKEQNFAGELIITPGSAFGSPWMRRFGNYSTAFASGWMRVRGHRRRRGFDRGFVISDHVDWQGLLRTIQETGAKRVFATHGYSDSLARYLREQGLWAEPLETLFEGEADDAAPDD